METKDSNNEKDMKNQNFDNKKFTNSSISKNKRDKPLPWWVELLFVQIGLPDKILIRILKTNKNIKELINNDKKLIFYFLFVLATLAYFYPVVKESKNKIDCEVIAKNYIIKNKNLTNLKRKELMMLSTNLCNGGEEIYKIEDLNN